MKKEQLKEVKIKLKEFYQIVKNFKLTKYLLTKKEGNLSDEIEIKETLIEEHEYQIVVDRAHATALESEIAILKHDIKQLQTNIKKIQNVIKLD